MPSNSNKSESFRIQFSRIELEHILSNLPHPDPVSQAISEQIRKRFVLVDAGFSRANYIQNPRASMVSSLGLDIPDQSPIALSNPVGAPRLTGAPYRADCYQRMISYPEGKYTVEEIQAAQTYKWENGLMSPTEAAQFESTL